VDSREDAIFSVKWNGGNRRVIQGNLPNPKGLAILKGDVYWVDRNLKKILKASKLPDQVAQPEELKAGLEDLRDISILDIQNQPRTQNNACSRLGNGGLSNSASLYQMRSPVAPHQSVTVPRECWILTTLAASPLASTSSTPPGRRSGRRSSPSTSPVSSHNHPSNQWST